MSPKKLLLLLATTVLLHYSYAQVRGWSHPTTPPPYGVFSMGTATGGSLDGGRSVCTDAAGNMYVYGLFGTGTDFDPSGGTVGLTSNGATAADMFVAKYNSSGALQWVVRGGVLNSTDNNTGAYGSIATDGTNVYVVGQLNMNATNTADFAPAAGGCTCNYAPGVILQQGFVAKLSGATGQWQWVNTWGDQTSGNSGQGVCLDGSGNIYITGQCNGNINVGPSPFTTSDADAFFAKLTPAGAWVWTKRGGGTGSDGLGSAGGGISYNSNLNRITATGSYNSTTTSFGSFGVPNTAGITDIYLAELDPTTGNFLNAIGFGSVANDEATNCYDPATHNIFLAGQMGGTMGSLPGVGSLTAAGGSNDIFVASYVPNTTPSAGTFVWAKSYGGANNDRAWGVTSDAAGSIVFCGTFLGNGAIDFGSGATTQVTSTSTTGGEIFVASVTAANGTGLWASQGCDNNSGNDQARGICSRQNGSGIFYVTGQIGNPSPAGTQVSMTPSSLGNAINLTSIGGTSDIFVGKIFGPPPLTATQSQVNLTCNGVCTGSATVVASGGVAPYTYSWSPSGGSGATASSLCAINYTCTITDASLTSIVKTFSINQPPAINITTISQTNVACFGGSNGAAQVSASGGTGTLTYSWSPAPGSGQGTTSVTGLTANNYTCTVTDANSCTAIRVFNITQPTTINITPISQTNVSCFGGNNGAASLTASGGSPGYTYSWSPAPGAGQGTASVTGLSQNTYTCTVTDANSCTRTQTFNITQPTAINITPISQTNISCFGGSNGAASLTALGGTGTLTYSWSPAPGSGQGTTSVTGLSQNTYTCTVTDANSCTRTQTFNITQPTVITSSIVSQTNISCNGGSNGAATISASGGIPGYTYSWAPVPGAGQGTVSVTGLSQNTYTCTITDANSCTRTQTVTITQPSAITITPISQTNVSCFGGSNGAASLSASGGTPGYTYSWSPAPGAGQGTASVTGLSQNTYTCTVTDASSCNRTQTFNITQPTAINITPISQTNVSCFGGSNGAASLTALGGTGTLTYSWSPAPGSGQGTTSVTGLSQNTYTCTVTDANSCTKTQTFNITQPTIIASSIVSQTNVSCNGGSNGTATISVSGGAPGYTYNWSPAPTVGQGTVSISGLSQNTYTCTITDANSCTRTQTVTITQPSAITITPISQTNVSCFGGSNGAASLSASGGTPGYTYNWLPAPGAGQGTPSITGLSQNNYTCTVTDANTCTRTQTFNITQPTIITSSIVSQTNVSCNGGSNGAATITASGGVPGYTYNWSPAPGGGQGTVSVTGLSQNIYTCTITDANGCTETQTVNITQPSPIVIGFSASPGTTVCEGTGVILNGTGGISYSWTGGILDGVSFTATSTTTYTVTGTDVNSCTNTTTVTITVNSLPIVTANTTDDFLCNGESTILTGGGASSYTWTSGVNDGVSFVPSSTTTYTVTGTDANSCSNTNTITITVNNLPTVTANATDDNLCNGESTILTGGGASSYTWTGGVNDGVSFTPIATTTYTVTGTDANSCANTNTITITVNNLPTVTANTTDDILCNGESTILTGGGASSYTWTSGVTDGVSFVPSSTTTYTVTGTDVNSCSNTATITVTVNNLPTVTANATDDILCNGESTILTGGGASSYTWTGGVTEGVSFIPSTTTTYTVTGTDVNSCSNTATITVTVNNLPTVTANATDDILCDGESTILTGSGASSYTWTGGVTEGVSFIPSSTTTYTVTGTDVNSCSNTNTITITVNNLPTVTANATDDILCDGESTILTGGGASSYTWTGGVTDGVSFIPSTTATYTVTGTDVNSCSNTNTITVIVNNLPIVTANATDDILCDGESTILTGGGANSYTWTGGVTDGTSFTPSATATYTVTGTDGNTCSNTATITVTVNSLPAVIFSYPGNDTICITSGIQVLSGGSPSGGNYSGTGVSGTNFDPNIAGLGNHAVNYSFTDANSCSNNASITIVVIGCNSVENNANANLVVYPNPFTRFININGLSIYSKVTVYSMSGEIVYNETSYSNELNISTETWRAATYMLVIQSEDGTITKKIIKH